METFSLFVGAPLTPLACLSAISFAQKGEKHRLYIYPEEQQGPEACDALRALRASENVSLEDARSFAPKPILFEHPTWPGFAPFADAFRYEMMARCAEPRIWVDSDSLLLDARRLPQEPFVASEYATFSVPTRTNGLFDAATFEFFPKHQKASAWFREASCPALITNSHCCLPDDYLLQELRQSINLHTIRKLPSGNAGMNKLGQLVRLYKRADWLCVPDLFNPIAAKDAEAFRSALATPLHDLRGRFPNSATLHIFRVTRELLGPEGLSVKLALFDSFWHALPTAEPPAVFLHPAAKCKPISTMA